LVNELLNFFQAASKAGAVQDKTISELYNYVSLNTQASAKAFARAAHFNKDQSKKINLINDMFAKINQAGNEVKGCLCLGELG
jgi:hypothetical protein